MKIYSNGECLVGMEEIIVKKYFDISYNKGIVKFIDSTSKEETELINLNQSKKYGFGNKEFQQILADYLEIKKYCYAETTLIDMIALISILLKNEILIKKQALKVLEVGSWGGASSYILSSILKTLNKKNRLFCMDTWQGTPNTTSHNIAKFDDMYTHFRNVMRYFDVDDIITPIVAESNVGFDIIHDHIFDFIFIDAAHTYSGVQADINEAEKKLNYRGILIGHDCECYYDELPIKNLDKDKEEDQGYHVGVIRALYDKWGRNYEIVPGSKVWYKIF